MLERVACIVLLSGAAPQPEPIMADDASEGIVSDEMEHEVFPAMAADPLGIS
jgi:hypothetical protein